MYKCINHETLNVCLKSQESYGNYINDLLCKYIAIIFKSTFAHLILDVLLFNIIIPLLLTLKK